VSRGPVSGLDWMHAVRDSKDIVIAALAVKYRRDKLGDLDVRYVKPATVKHVALALASFMNGDGVCEVGYPTLKERLKLPPQTVRRACLLLVQAGWLLVEPGGSGARDTNVYSARIPHHAEFYKGRSVPRGSASKRAPGDEKGPPGAPEEERRRTTASKGKGRDHTQLVGEGTAA
jgi:hypothetical protein